MPGQRTQQFIKTLLLVAMGVFLYSRIANGTLYYYINERFSIFTLIGVGGLLLLGLGYRWERSGVKAQDGGGTHHHHDDHHGHSHALTWAGITVIALPIVLGLAVPPQPLGAAALANRDITLSMNESALPSGLRHREKASVDKNIMDWWQEFRSAPPSAEGMPGATMLGEQVQVSGFVYTDEQYGADHFLVTRFVVSCCVADANVLGLLVQLPDGIALEDDQWVEVQGTFVANNIEGWMMPVIEATAITTIDVPNQPYLYP